MLDKNQMRPAIRWVLLKTTHPEIAGVWGVTDQMLYSTLQILYKWPDKKMVREEMDYLARRGLMEVKRSEVDPWSAKLTRIGQDMVEHRIPVDAGIERPPYETEVKIKDFNRA